MASLPETHYAKSGDINIAYQVTGTGPRDMILVPGWVSHLENDWEEPGSARFLERLGSFCRLIRFDKRGTGLSDRPGGMPDLETRMDDVRAVMDATDSRQAVVFGYSEGGPMSVLFAATYPARTESLVLYGSYAKRRDPVPEYPWAPTWAQRQADAAEVERTWAQEADLGKMAPNADEQLKRWWRARARASASPGAARDLILMNSQIDVRHVLPTVSVPTLVLHRRGDRDSSPDEGRYIAAHIPGARFVLLEGDDHPPYMNPDPIVDEIEEFVTGVRPAPDLDRMLATVVFTDIVGSTETAAQLGDSDWSRLLDRHHHVVRQALATFRGREVDTAGDGFLATFDGPARAIRFALAAGDGVRPLGLELRAGVHTGEIELAGEDVRGLAVHIGARVASLAGPGQVLVSSTVRDLTAGSGIDFEDFGARQLKGVPGEWRLYSVAPPA